MKLSYAYPRKCPTTLLRFVLGTLLMKLAPDHTHLLSKNIHINQKQKSKSMIRKYHNHTPQTNPRHCEEEPQNTDCHNASGRQLKQSSQLSSPHEDDCRTRRLQNAEQQNKDQTQMGATINNKSTTTTTEPPPYNRQQPKPLRGV